jgi:hypothetical protein
VFERGNIPVVIYQANTQINSLLAGMIVACHPSTKHFVIGDIEAESVSGSSSFSQIHHEVSITYHQSMPDGMSNDALITVCCPDDLSCDVFFANNRLMLIEPTRPKIILARKHVAGDRLFPGPVLSVIGWLSALPLTVREIGLNRLCFVLKCLIKTRYPRFIKFTRLIRKLIRGIYKLPLLVMSMPWQIYQYVHTQKRLKSIKPPEKKAYPYDDYSAHM